MDLYEKLTEELVELNTKKTRTLKRHRKQIAVIEQSIKDLGEHGAEQVLESGLLKGEWELDTDRYSSTYQIVTRTDMSGPLYKLLSLSCSVFKTDYGRICRIDFGNDITADLSTKIRQGHMYLVLKLRFPYRETSILTFLDKCREHGIKVSIETLTKTQKILREQASYLQNEIDRWTLKALETSS